MRNKKSGGDRSAMPVYTLPDLPYDYSALAPVISPEIIELHHDKHHAAYVKGANDSLEQLAEARDKEQWGSVNGLEKNLAFHLSGHILHSIYWHNMTGAAWRRTAGHGRTRWPGGRHHRVLRFLRGLQGPAHQGRSHNPGLRLGRTRLRTPERPPDRRADLRPPGQRRPGLHPSPRLRRLGARLLPPVQEPEGRLHRRDVGGRQLAGRGAALRGGEVPPDDPARLTSRKRPAS